MIARVRSDLPARITVHTYIILILVLLLSPFVVFFGSSRYDWSQAKTQQESGRGAAWLAHLLWEQGVGGSNPLAPTYKPLNRHWGGERFFAAQLPTVATVICRL